MVTFKRLPIGETLPVNHKLAGIVPMAGEAEQASLTQDIMANGLREPVKLWRGEIVDGRCRQKACKLANVAVDATELDDALTEEEVRVFVKSVNTRRNLTHTQKTMSAARIAMEKVGPSIPVTAKAWAVSKVLVNNAVFIEKNAPTMANDLFNGKSVKIVNQQGAEVETNKVSAVYAYLKREVEDVKEDVEHGWDDNSAIKTQAGKDWYYQEVAKMKITDVYTRQRLAELANYKFTKKKDA